MSRKVSLSFRDFAHANLEARAEHDGVPLEDLVAVAVRYYVTDLPEKRTARGLPRFARARENLEGGNLEGGRSVSLELDARDAAALDDEAVRQGVSIEALIEHAAMYYLADLNSGRVAMRILRGAEASED